MKMAAHAMTTCLWFDTQAEQAAKFYTSIFEDSKIGSVARYGKEGHEIHGKDAGSVMTVEFEIGGQKLVGFTGGRTLNSKRRYPSRCTARRRKRLIISGASSATVARKAPAA